MGHTVQFYRVLCGVCAVMLSCWCSVGHTDMLSSVLPEEQDYTSAWQSIRVFGLTRSLSRPLRVFVQQTGPFYRPQYREAAHRALSEWATALEGRLVYTWVETPEDADITIRWVSGFSDPDQAGETTVMPGHADIELMTPGLPEALIQANLLHELGHALGIESHSDSPQDMMTAVQEWHTTTGDTRYRPHLSPQDIQAIRRLYSGAWQPGEDLYQTPSRAQTTPVPSLAASAMAVPASQPVDQAF